MYDQSIDINPIKKEKAKLYYKCQQYYSSYSYNYNSSVPSTTTTLTKLNDSSHYTRIYYPMCSFDSFFNLNIKFDPFNHLEYCYFESEYDGNHIHIRPFTFTLKPDQTEINIETDINYIEGITITGATKHDFLNNLKMLASYSRQTDFITEVRNDDINCGRYLADPDDIIGQIDDDEISTQLTDGLELLLSDLDTYGVINYQKLVQQNIDNIQTNIIKEIISDIMCSPTYIFNLFLSPDTDIEPHHKNICYELSLNQKNLRILQYIKPFKNMVETLIDDDAFIDCKTYGTTNKLIEVHNLVIWGLVKYIHTIFKGIYVTIKKVETYQTNSSKSYKLDKLDNLSDDELDGVDLTGFWGDDFWGGCQLSPTISQPTKQEEFNLLEYKGSNILQFTSFHKQINQRNPYQFINIDSLTSIDRENMLENYDLDSDYSTYQKLIPINNKRVKVRRY